MKLNVLRALGLAVAGTALVAACSSHSSHTGALASGHPLASVPGYDKQAALTVLVNDGVPVHGTLTQQAAWAKQLLSKSGRAAVAKQLAIPAANRPAFENEAEADAKKDHVLTSHQGRITFLETDLPGLLVKYGHQK